MIVGDLILACRESVTDQPPTLYPPNTANTAVVAQNGSPLVSGLSYYVKVTMLNAWGETLYNGELGPFTITGPNQGIQITAFGPINQAVIIRAYFGLAGAENSYIQIPLAANLVGPPGVTFVIGDTTQVYGTGYPPTRNSAYLPDLDGDAISASTMFRFLNDALKLASQISGGLLDYSGVGSLSGVPQYIVNGEWKKVASCWYDGYPLAMDDNGNYFRRNSITASVLSSVAMSTFNNQMMIEVWPQPSRTAGITTLAAQILIGQTSAQLTSAAQFLLTNGFVQIGSEIMSYSQINGNTLLNLQRALGGTVQSVIPAGSLVNELNLFWSGWRMYNPNFIPGQSNLVIPAPLGWETALFKYMLGRCKLAEQGVGDFEKLEQSFLKQIGDWWRSNKVVVGPRQIGDQSQGLETYFGGQGGGWVVPAVLMGLSLAMRV